MNKKQLLFSYGTLVLPRYLKLFDSVVLDSVFAREHKIILSDVYKPLYYFQLVKGEAGDVAAGFLLETDKIEEIDLYEGPAYERKQIIVYNKRLEATKCWTYFKK